MSIERHEPATLPDGLRERVLAASEQARVAGRSFPDVADISPTTAFHRAVDAFESLLVMLDESDWRLPVVNLFDVHGLVGHLIAVEQDVHRCIRGDPDVADLDHVESTRLRAAAHSRTGPVRLRTAWRRNADRTLELVAAAADLDLEVAMHGMHTTLGRLLIVRTFELWTHDNDIRRAAGLPSTVPDASTLRLMTALAAGALPVGADRVGLLAATRVRLVLTGAGGGTWDVTVGSEDLQPVPIRIVADAVGFCRLAANRVTPNGLDLDVTGDADRAGLVLAAVSALALD